MVTDKVNHKELTRIYFTVLGFVILFIGTLIGLSMFSSPKRDSQLKTTCELILNEKTENKYYVQDSLKINSAMNTSSKVFLIQDRKTGEHSYAVIIRVQTIYGAFPCVFTFNKSKGTEFIGYTNVNGRIKTILDEDKTNVILNYWTSRIPLIISQVEEAE